VKIVCVGGGPAGLYFALLLKQADARHEVTVLERNRPDDTFGFGVVLSDATLENFAKADAETHRAITRALFHWDDIDVHYGGQVITSTGHGFAGMSRQALLDILRRRGEALGVRYRFETEVEDVAAYADADVVLAADGVNSAIRNRHAEHFGPDIDVRPNKFVWLGTTVPFSAFTFLFKDDPHGLWRVHAYRYNATHSTFIVETTEEAWLRAGLASATEDDTVTFCERLFERELAGHALLKNRSLWRSFPVVKNRRWCWGNIALIGDAAHTAHFSIGSGTKLAMEDAIALATALKTHDDVPAALAHYDRERRAAVESTQRAAQVSLEWFEHTERYYGRLSPVQFTFSLLTRSLRVGHDNLRVRDRKFVETVDRAVAEEAERQSGLVIPLQPPPPPMFTPFRLRELVLPNRVVVAPLRQDAAEDGTPNDWHLVHLGSRAVGGAGLVMAEMTAISRDARVSRGGTGLYLPEHAKAWARIAAFVHRSTGAKLGVQVVHAGRKAATRPTWEGADEPLPTGGWPLMSASPIPYRAHGPVPRAMTRADMDRVRDDSVLATAMADVAGFDLLELHFGDGYLLGSFISPLSNHRTDDNGGSLAQRLRFPLEVFDAVRGAWPEAKPLSVRISAQDWVPGGITAADAVYVAARLRAHGCDVIHVSTGQSVAHEAPRRGRLYQTPFADRIRHEVDIPTMTVGTIASHADVNSIVAAGRADLCVLARAHLQDPYWTRHAAIAQGYDVPWPPPYSAVQTFVARGAD
jgi:anthraniloyl-CoA monooxygenase